MTRSRLAAASLIVLAVAGTAHADKPAAPPKATVDTGVISGLGARNIGSATMSGRISAVSAIWRADHLDLYVGAASGGVWKSQDGGTTFKPVFDKQPVQSIGAIAIDPSNPDTVWVGSGESWMRNSVSIGDGVYKSVDGGQTWASVGLPASEHIAKIIVDPADGNTVYVCAPGRLWSDSADRGLYKTTDGGRTWVQVLKGPNLSTGCSTIAMDPRDPKVIFAGLWDFRRKGWTFRSGGEGPDSPSGSAMLRSADGGKTWTRLDADSAKGLPKGPWGRVAVSIAPSNPNRVYALVESARSALYCSDDGGRTWSEGDRSQMMVWRPFYFANLVVDPNNPDRIFKPDLGLIVSEDGGKSFSSAQGGMHPDDHDLWIDPKDTKHIIAGNDGGLWTSHDGGGKWDKINNLPVSQFYHVSVNDKDPYEVFGGLQDNSDWVAPSEYPGGITNGRWENLGGGDGFWVFSDPSDPNFAYAESQGGELTRVDRRTLVARSIKPQANYKEKLRYNWNTPLALSPTDPNVLYIGAQFLFRTRDHGQSWERISPDLTTNDPEMQKQEQSGGITVDNSAAETHATIYSISESPKDSNLIWVGTDDGNVQLTRDGAKTWVNVTANIKGMAKGNWTSWVEASRYDPAVAYAAFDRHTFGDMEPHVYRTRDFGKTWTPIVSPASGVRGFAHVIKEDRLKPDLLYLGTEFGLWISADGGATWAQFKGGDLPDVPVRDIALQAGRDDMVLATHGRGIWIVDDISPLRALTPEVLNAQSAFLPGRPVMQRLEANGGWSDGDGTFAGANPADGAVINFYQRTRHVFGKLKIEILNAKGEVIDDLPASKRRGINRVVWSMRLKPPRTPPAAQVAFNSAFGPRVPPGAYTVRITDNGRVLEQKIDVALDPRGGFDVAGRQAQFDAVMQAHTLLNRMSDVVDRIKGLQALAGADARTLPENDPLRAQLQALIADAQVQLTEIVATKEGGAITGEERIREHADQIYGALMSYEGRPGDYQVARVAALSRELDGVTAAVDTLVAREVPPINDALTKRGLKPLSAGALKEAAIAAQGDPFDPDRKTAVVAAAQERDRSALSGSDAAAASPRPGRRRRDSGR
jgi:photosystem II stability/assembly factor-like uncharacterized protein